MTIEEVLDLDCREKENYETIQRCLKKIKPLSKYNTLTDVPIDKIEKLINVMTKKYNMYIYAIILDMLSNEDKTIWKTSVLVDEDTHLSRYVFGVSLYEVLAKAAIYMYSIRNKVGTKKEV